MGTSHLCVSSTNDSLADNFINYKDWLLWFIQYGFVFILRDILQQILNVQVTEEYLTESEHFYY